MKHQKRGHGKDSPFASLPVFPEASDTSRPQNLCSRETAGFIGRLLFRFFVTVGAMLLVSKLLYALEPDLTIGLNLAIGLITGRAFP